MDREYTDMNPMECAQLCASAEQAMRHGSDRLAGVPKAIMKIIRYECWKVRQLPCGRVFKLSSLSELITAPPLRGWGEDPRKVEALLKDDPKALAMFREAMKHQGERTDIVDNINEVGRSTGTSKSYTCARLQRDHPKLFERVCNGELSVHAAAIEAGFRKVKTPDEKAIDAFRKCDNPELVVSEILRQLDSDTLNRLGISAFLLAE